MRELPPKGKKKRKHGGKGARKLNAGRRIRAPHAFSFFPRRFMKQVGLSQAVEEDRRMARANNLNGNPTPHPLCKN